MGPPDTAKHRWGLHDRLRCGGVPSCSGRYARSHFGHHAASPAPWCRELGFACFPLGLSRRRWVHRRRDCEVVARDYPLDPWSSAACCCRGAVHRRQMHAQVTTMGSAQPYVDMVRRGHSGGHGGRDNPRGKRSRRTGAADLRTPRGDLGGCPCRMAAPPPGSRKGTEQDAWPSANATRSRPSECVLRCRKSFDRRSVQLKWGKCVKKKRKK